MGRWLIGILLWSWLALLGACIQIAPRSSVPFHAPADRHARYAAEATLAIKEERRDAYSEAAANARLVLPQMPEIWGTDGSEPVRDVVVSADIELASPEPSPTGRRRRAPAPLPAGCAGLLADCERPFHVPPLAATPLLAAAITPAAAPVLASVPQPASPYHFHLYFGLDSTALDAAARRVLKGALGSAMMVRPVRVIVAGHADRSGADGYNRRLSQRRAAAVVSALIRAGMPAELIETMALGESAPLIPTDDGAAHVHNRRVEIILV